MSGAVEFGKCEVCGKESTLSRTHFDYPIRCECHSPNHFEMVRHCDDCTPKEPRETKIILRTENVEECQSCEKTFFSGVSGDFVNGHPFCLKCLVGMAEESANLGMAFEKACEEAADSQCPHEVEEYECEKCKSCSHENELYENTERDIECWKQYYLSKAKEI
jgi:hypothetical protein